MAVTRFPSYLRLIGPGATAATPGRTPTRIHPELLAEADRDPVTGAATREALLARLEMVGSLAPAMPLSFVAVHLEGGESERAELLRAVAGRVRELTRPTDAVGRLDHETIGVVLQGTGATAAGPVAARLAHHLNHMAGAPRGFSVTVSAATGTGVNAATLPAAALDSFAGACG
ncbi:MAG TPA: GGDEF domain-containing protein [Tepidiformaceae bacterium]|jgi:GGDEF domain-containing protein|nr:GGDEF domain-containing protein [Tepidiformaceae bacterium]